MSALAMSRIVAALTTLTIASGCTDTSGPTPPDRTGGTMTVVPRSATIQAGQVVELKARLNDEFGEAIQGVNVKWTSSNESVASVSAYGNVLGQGAGDAVITASAANHAQTASIHVLRRQPKPSEIDP